MSDPAPTHQLSFPALGLSCEVDPGDTVVDAVFRHDLPVKFKCERAVCATCLVDVIRGMEHLSGPNDREKGTLKAIHAEPNWRLSCQLTVQGDVALDYIPITDPRRRKNNEG